MGNRRSSRMCDLVLGHEFSLEVSTMRSTSNSGVQGLNALRIIAVLLLMICDGLSVQGQTVFGRISGTVKDANGGSIPNATVTITNLATNLVRTATTDGDGFYRATNLPAGSYSVAAVGKGFKKAEQSGVSVVADARLTVDITLEPGQVTETVQVSTVAGETVNTTSGEVGRVVDQRQVQNLAFKRPN